MLTSTMSFIMCLMVVRTGIIYYMYVPSNLPLKAFLDDRQAYYLFHTWQISSLLLYAGIVFFKLR